MKHLILIIIMLSCLSAGCQKKPVELIKTYYKKMATADTSGVRKLFHEKIINLEGENHSYTITVQVELSDILVNNIIEAHASIKDIITYNDTMVEVVTNEWPSYLFRKYQPSDTINYIYTFFFKNNKIYKVKTDSLPNANYCYACNSFLRDQHIDSFFFWLSQKDYMFYSKLNDYYASRYNNPDLYLETTEFYESKLKEYYLSWDQK